jgi:hypothetical protein
MRLVKLEYGRVDGLSYWVNLSLSQGEFTRDPSLNHVNLVKWITVKTQWAWGSDIQGLVVMHSWVLF